MIQSESNRAAFQALARLIVHAKDRSFAAENEKVAELLNDIELLPEYLGDQIDRTDEFKEALCGIAEIHPDCQYIVEEFLQSSNPVSGTVK